MKNNKIEKRDEIERDQFLKAEHFLHDETLDEEKSYQC